MKGSRRATGAPRRGTCKALPIRHGTAVTPSPLGKGAGVVALGRDSSTVAPLRVRLAPSAMGVRGGVLLRRPTEATHAPPVMGRIWQGAAHLFRMYRIRSSRRQQHRPTITAKGVQGGNGPLAPHDRVAAHPLCGVTPASAARPPRAVPPRNPHDTPTRAQATTEGAQPNRAKRGETSGVQRDEIPLAGSRGRAPRVPFLLD